MRTDTWALSLVNSKGPGHISELDSKKRAIVLDSHATNVMKDPAVAPAAPKHATVEKFGYVPGVLT